MPEKDLGVMNALPPMMDAGCILDSKKTEAEVRQA